MSNVIFTTVFLRVLSSVPMPVGISQLISTSVFLDREISGQRGLCWFQWRGAFQEAFPEGGVECCSKKWAWCFGQDNHKSSDRLPECAYANLCQLTNGTAFAQCRKEGDRKGGCLSGALGRVYINVICVVVLFSFIFFFILFFSCGVKWEFSSLSLTWWW